MRRRWGERACCVRTFMQFMCVDKKKRNGNGQDKNGKTQTFQRDEESNALIFWIDCEVSFAWLD